MASDYESEDTYEPLNDKFSLPVEFRPKFAEFFYNDFFGPEVHGLRRVTRNHCPPCFRLLIRRIRSSASQRSSW